MSQPADWKPDAQKPNLVLDHQGDDNFVQAAITAAQQAANLKESEIKKLLRWREQIDQGLKSLGYEPIGAPNGHKTARSSKDAAQPKRPTGPKPFKELSLANVGKILLRDQGTLHGSDIERLAKDGGFKSESENFQAYLAVAFKRAGGFENIGRNQWKLNPKVPPSREPRGQ
jgi:hypothetical protein